MALIDVTCNINCNHVYRVLQSLLPSVDGAWAIHTILSLRLVWRESVSTRALFLCTTDEKLANLLSTELAIIAGVSEDRLLRFLQTRQPRVRDQGPIAIGSTWRRQI